MSAESCLFCHLVREGDHLRKADGFVAIPDINPEAEVHILIVPERHIDTFRDIAEFPAQESKRMLDFIAETAATASRLLSPDDGSWLSTADSALPLPEATSVSGGLTMAG